MKKKEFEVLTIQPTKAKKGTWRKNRSCLRDAKTEREFQIEVISLFKKYKKYPMLAVQNCKINREKSSEDALISFPDEDSCFYIARNYFTFIEENGKKRKKADKV